MRSIGLLIPLLFSQLCFCQTSPDQPSLEVTMNWLTLNLRSARSEVATETISFDKNGKPKKKIKKDTIYATILIAQANGCDLTITTQVRWNLDLAKTIVETIPMGRVSRQHGRLHTRGSGQGHPYDVQSPISYSYLPDGPVGFDSRLDHDPFDR